MNLQNQPPVLVPVKFRREIEKLSKAALMDMAWDYAFQLAGTDDDKAIEEFRARREIVLMHRHSAKVGGAQ